MAKFAISEISILQIYLPIFLYNLMHCLIVTILCCVDDHFTSFVAIVLLTMVCSEFCCHVQYLG